MKIKIFADNKVAYNVERKNMLEEHEVKALEDLIERNINMYDRNVLEDRLESDDYVKVVKPEIYLESIELSRKAPDFLNPTTDGWFLTCQISFDYVIEDEIYALTKNYVNSLVRTLTKSPDLIMTDFNLEVLTKKDNRTVAYIKGFYFYKEEEE